MIDGTARMSSAGSGHADGQQADSASELVEKITRQREWERTGTAVHGATTVSAADALLAVFAIDEEQWAKLLAELPPDTLAELLGHAFRLYQRIAVEETSRRFERDAAGPPETSSFRTATEK